MEDKFITRSFGIATSAVSKYADFLTEAVYGASPSTFLFIGSEIVRVEGGVFAGQISFAITDRADYIKSWKEGFRKVAENRVELNEANFEFSATEVATAQSV